MRREGKGRGDGRGRGREGIKHGKFGATQRVNERLLVSKTNK